MQTLIIVVITIIVTAIVSVIIFLKWVSNINFMG